MCSISIGIGAHANKVLEDSEIVIYEYGGYNLNKPEYRNENHVYDGSITILKNCFAESDTHEKIKKIPSDKKKLTEKRISVDVNYPRMIADGRIVIENCSNCWHTTDDERHIDIMVSHILFKLFDQYKEEGKFPEYISYNV